MTLIASVIAVLRGRMYTRVRVATHPYTRSRAGGRDDPTIRFQSKVKTRLTFTALRRRLLAVTLTLVCRQNLAGRLHPSTVHRSRTDSSHHPEMIRRWHSDPYEFPGRSGLASRYILMTDSDAWRHMSYDCCGDGRTIGDSFNAGLRNALRFAHEHLDNVLVDSRSRSWLLLSVVAVISLLLTRWFTHRRTLLHRDAASH